MEVVLAGRAYHPVVRVETQDFASRGPGGEEDEEAGMGRRFAPLLSRFRVSMENMW